MRRKLRFKVSVAGLVLTAGLALAEPVRDGNVLALDWTRANPAGRKALLAEHSGVFHTFRYLKVTDIVRPSPMSAAARLTATEPSSDMLVQLTVEKRLSLELIAQLQTGDCVAAKGRVQGIDTNAPVTMRVEPALILYKDRGVPKAGKELLNEVDSQAH